MVSGMKDCVWEVWGFFLQVTGEPSPFEQESQTHAFAPEILDNFLF